jgi:threonine 3-dehydrogenase
MPGLLRPATRLLSRRGVRGFVAAASPRILFTGSCGQVGCELIPHLRSMLGDENVIATDVREPPQQLLDGGPFFRLDVTDALALERMVTDHKVTTIVHLAALLSATGEKNPQLALQVNNMGVTNVLEAARVHQLSVFSPSTIAVFGPSTPKANTPDETVMRPTTIYGVTKVSVPSAISACA